MKRLRSHDRRIPTENAQLTSLVCESSLDQLLDHNLFGFQVGALQHSCIVIIIVKIGYMDKMTPHYRTLQRHLSTFVEHVLCAKRSGLMEHETTLQGGDHATRGYVKKGIAKNPASWSASKTLKQRVLRAGHSNGFVVLK
jgi:hypothetical protein